MCQSSSPSSRAAVANAAVAAHLTEVNYVLLVGPFAGLSAVQVLREFVRKVDVSGNGMVRRELFRDYYMELSTSIEDDEQFEEIVHLSWYPQRRQEAWGKAEATEVEGGYGGGEEGRRRSRGNTKETSSSSRGKSPWRTRPF